MAAKSDRIDFMFLGPLPDRYCNNPSNDLFETTIATSSYPGWIKSPHVVTLSILKILHLKSLKIPRSGGGCISE